MLNNLLKMLDVYLAIATVLLIIFLIIYWHYRKQAKRFKQKIATQIATADALEQLQTKQLQQRINLLKCYNLYTQQSCISINADQDCIVPVFFDKSLNMHDLLPALSNFCQSLHRLKKDYAFIKYLNCRFIPNHASIEFFCNFKHLKHEIDFSLYIKLIEQLALSLDKHAHCDIPEIQWFLQQKEFLNEHLPIIQQQIEITLNFNYALPTHAFIKTILLEHCLDKIEENQTIQQQNQKLQGFYKINDMDDELYQWFAMQDIKTKENDIASMHIICLPILHQQHLIELFKQFKTETPCIKEDKNNQTDAKNTVNKTKPIQINNQTANTSAMHKEIQAISFSISQAISEALFNILDQFSGELIYKSDTIIENKLNINHQKKLQEMLEKDLNTYYKQLLNRPILLNMPLHKLKNLIQ